MIYRTSAALVGLCSFVGNAIAAVHASDNWIVQSWLFDWDPLSVDPTVSIPQTAQCETIDIHWSRASGNVPDYVPPFFLRIYTSTYPAPIVVPAGDGLNTSFVVPFAPGTQYQICMVDSQGNSGGCQASYTVYPNNTLSIDPKTKNATLIPPTCANVTYPAQRINATGVDVNGPLTQMAWADQCTDISITPLNGTPPFVLTVAPSYHPPLNITSTTMGAINWTVTLGWAHQFYLSLTDKDGFAWSTGPLHSGGNGLTDCLVLGGNSLGVRVSLNPSKSSTVLSKALIGATIGALCAGILFGSGIFWILSRPRRVNNDLKKRKDNISDMSDSRPPTRYTVNPYVIAPDTETTQQETEGAEAISRSTSPNSPRMVPAGPTRQTSDPSSHQVYLVHHDGGRPPISVYHPEGASIVELPPSYGPRSPLDPPAETQTNTGPQPRSGRRTMAQKMGSGSDDISTGQT